MSPALRIGCTFVCVPAVVVAIVLGVPAVTYAASDTLFGVVAGPIAIVSFWLLRSARLSLAVSTIGAVTLTALGWFAALGIAIEFLLD
jgi:hypothetical protein